MSGYAYSDGGRRAAGFTGDTGDCAVRAIAIATGLPYGEVYTRLFAMNRRRYRGKKGMGSLSPRHGVTTPVIRAFMAEQGWQWTPTMKIGSGCTVHLRANELPAGRVMLSVSRHVCTMIDGVVYDTHDPRRDGTRCVYGHWTPPSPERSAQ